MNPSVKWIKSWATITNRCNFFYQMLKYILKIGSKQCQMIGGIMQEESKLLRVTQRKEVMTYYFNYC